MNEVQSCLDDDSKLVDAYGIVFVVIQTSGWMKGCGSQTQFYCMVDAEEIVEVWEDVGGETVVIVLVWV